MHNDAFSTNPTPATSFGNVQAVIDWQMALGRSLLQAQRQQWETMAAWQRSGAIMQRELMDQWICRFGGGVPLDG
ncbi:hypothetical protein [Variovorax boronicumulans]|uniref:hypothetical protein n=1 Tax=Variovorax boronicumulans TaxID=436515 RepID=UPI0033967ECD